LARVDGNVRSGVNPGGIAVPAYVRSKSGASTALPIPIVGYAAAE
jgi:hypothetical protein